MILKEKETYHYKKMSKVRKQNREKKTELKRRRGERSHVEEREGGMERKKGKEGNRNDKMRNMCVCVYTLKKGKLKETMKESEAKEKGGGGHETEDRKRMTIVK